METHQGRLLSRLPRANALGVTIIGPDGKVMSSEDPATRLNRLINQALGRERLALRATQAAPVQISSEGDSLKVDDGLLDEVRAALAFARSPTPERAQ